jgi:hypothetical protein
MLLIIFAATGLMSLVSMCVLSHVCSGYNFCVVVDQLVSALLLCRAEWRIASWAWHSARFSSNRSWWRYFWSNDLLL